MQAGGELCPEGGLAALPRSGGFAPGDGALQGRAAAAAHGSAIFVAHTAKRVFGAGCSLFAEIHHHCGGHKQQERTSEGDQVYSHNYDASQADLYSAVVSY
jgi:hypothetical protein